VSFSALLSHTAGYNVHGFDGYPANHAPLSLEDVLSGRGNSPRLRRIKPYGQQFMYSGGGYTLAELAFTRLTGTTLREAFQKEVAKPLKLKRSGFFQPLDEELIENAAFGGRLAEKEDPARGFHYYPEHAAAGFWTTPTELTKIGVALSRSYRKGGLLKQETARRMLTPVMDSYGLGIQSFRGDIGYHDGWNEGFLTTWLFSLREDLCVAVMFNRSTDELDWAQTNIAIELFQTLEVELAEDAGVDKSGWAAFCGKYEQNDEAFRIDEICLEQEKLWAKVLTEEGEQRYELYPIGEKRFGRKGGFASISFGENCLTINDGEPCKKL
jgi:CubicO group peptidase (beta-lactamase class C family)